MNFPVYDDSKSGGTNKFTQVRKIVGKHQVLKRDLISELGYKKEYVNINPVTGHINIKVSQAATQAATQSSTRLPNSIK